LDESVVFRGPRLDASSQASLLAIISNEDIKIALLSIGDDKSRGQIGSPLSSLRNLGMWLGRIFVLQ
jgi:hypothetical protein